MSNLDFNITGVGYLFPKHGVVFNFLTMFVKNIDFLFTTGNIFRLQYHLISINPKREIVQAEPYSIVFYKIFVFSTITVSKS